LGVADGGRNPITFEEFVEFEIGEFVNRLLHEVKRRTTDRFKDREREFG